MVKKGTSAKSAASQPTAAPAVHGGRPSALLDTRVIYCGDNLEQLAKLPDAGVDLTYIDPVPLSTVEGPFNSNRSGGANWEVFRGETKEKRPSKNATKELHKEFL